VVATLLAVQILVTEQCLSSYSISLTLWLLSWL